MDRNAKIRLGYSIFLSVFTVVVGILFLAEASDLYFSGVAQLGSTQGMYSREAVGGRLLNMLAPILLWVAAVVLGVFVQACFPLAKSRKTSRNDLKIYVRLRKKVTSERDESLYSALKNAERVRLGVRIFCTLFCLLAAGMCIAYLADASHFTSLAGLTSDVLHMVANVLPWAGAAFLLLAGEAVYEVYFARKQLPKLKQLVAGGGAAPREQRHGLAALRIFGKEYVLWGMRFALLAVAVVFLCVGALNGGANDVLIKAINICTECIGLG